MWHPEPDRLALAASPADDDVLTHLAACPMCREHVDVLRRTVEQERSGRSGTDGTPPLPARVWQGIVDALGAEDPRAEPDRSRWRAVAVPVAAAVIGAAVGAVAALGIAAPTGTPIANLAPVGGTDAAAHGTVDALDRDDGHQLLVRLDGVTDLAGADHLEAWLTDAAGRRLHSLGSLAQDGSTFRGTFTVPADLPMAAFGTVDISAETWDGGPAHSRVSLLRGPLR